MIERQRVRHPRAVPNPEEMLGHFMRRDLIPKPKLKVSIPNLAFSCICSCHGSCTLDKHADNLAPVVVGDPDARRGRDIPVLKQDLLDVRREDVFSSLNKLSVDPNVMPKLDIEFHCVKQGCPPRLIISLTLPLMTQFPAASIDTRSPVLSQHRPCASRIRASSVFSWFL